MKSRHAVGFGLSTLPLLAATLPLTSVQSASAQTTPEPAPAPATQTPSPPSSPLQTNEPVAVPVAPATIEPPPPALAVPATNGGAPSSAAAPMTATPAPSDVTVTTPAAPAPPAVPASPAAEDDVYKKINMSFWLRIGGNLQNPVRGKRLDRLSTNGEVEAHFNNRMRKWLQWTADFVGTYGAGSIDGAGQLAILDLIAQFEPIEAFNFWAGRMLVPSDRANFAGPYFMAPWNYPGAFGAGPRQGPFGRNDGATIWGQFGGGIFKYYVGAYNLYGAQRPSGQYTAPLFSGRLNLSLLNPEPGYYHNATYYGKDILAIGVGAQYQKNGTASANPVGGPDADYSLLNADLLFEKVLGGAGVIDIEGAFYKYFGDNETRDFSHFLLASYLTPDVAGIGRFQPLFRLQQTTYRDVSGSKPDPATAVDAQVGYVVDQFATRFAFGLQHARVSTGDVANQIYAGIQLMK